MLLESLERREEKLLPANSFYKRLILFGLLSLAIVLFSLIIGIIGYMSFEGFGLIDAFLNAAMLMGGMGPISVLHTDEGKIFAGVYAMYCGFILIFSVAIFMTPIFHRLLHHFHLEGRK
jgi:sterol desaturase/sphingolipid hydroxylase (fatty acid hydroxylase superfamily)